MSIQTIEDKDEAEGGRQRRAAIAYIRSSSRSQGESGVGMAAQLAGIKRFADAAGYELIETIPEIASARGANNLSKRPGLINALKEAHRRNAVLIVYDWTRLTRHADDIAVINILLPERQIISVKDEERLSRASEIGRLGYSQKQGEAISRRTKEGMARKKALEGVQYGNPAIRSLQPAGTAAASEKANVLREAVAAVLDELGGLNHGLTNPVLAAELNRRDLRTGQNKAFNARTVVGPRKDAEEIIRARSADGPPAAIVPDTHGDGAPKIEHSPNWGRF